MDRLHALRRDAPSGAPVALGALRVVLHREGAGVVGRAADAPAHDRPEVVLNEAGVELLPFEGEERRAQAVALLDRVEAVVELAPERLVALPVECAPVGHFAWEGV